MIFAIFCFRLAAGLMIALLVLPVGMVVARFYRIHLLIVMALTITATLFVWNQSDTLFVSTVSLVILLCLLGSLLWTGKAYLLGIVGFVLAIAALLMALLTLQDYSSIHDYTWISYLLEDITCAALLGISTTAMLMGHWYLIAPTLSLEPLLRLLISTIIAISFRMIVALSTWWDIDFSLASLDVESIIWLSLRWGAGILGALILTWMAWKSAQIRSTQSATGILYVVVIMVFLGETAQLLLAEHLHYLH